ncbi:hypothetical protein MNO14_13220 [Luteimonas sp. S4-F44]|uniref:hypothetical protein n=1 Tax=Luteimonas sp. S4-F44 TaxID=2925842 RepID=UPI001F534C2C|nr:hypothetical protein [Luteimonas sp. S4-F44]UNK41907.1 hypothetical protein MNO14_13220 [Luteimonas sp. S4-F44]
MIAVIVFLSLLALERAGGRTELSFDVAGTDRVQVFYAGPEGGFSEDASVTLGTAASGRVRAKLGVGRHWRELQVRLDAGRPSDRILLSDLRLRHAWQTVQVPVASLACSNDLSIESSMPSTLRYRVTGDDPYLCLLPIDLNSGLSLSTRFSWAMAAGGIWLLFELSSAAVLARVVGARSERVRGSASSAANGGCASRVNLLVATVVACVMGWVVLAIAGLAPETARMVPALAFGLPLFLGSIAFAAVGCALFAGLGIAPARAQVGLWSLAGQALLIVYVYLRSLPSAAGIPIPVTQIEIVLLALAAIAYLALSGRGRAARAALLLDKKSLCGQLVLIALVCIAVASRELPRVAMLSSDPDQHAFFAYQVAHLGGVPWRQIFWGGEDLNYPAGTGVYFALWSWLGFLDVRNATAAVPFIAYTLGAIAIVDCALARIAAKEGGEAPTAWVALVLLFGLFLLPGYPQYAHQEGLGRVVSFAFMAGLTAVMFMPGAFASRAAVLLLFAVSVHLLNPVSIFATGVLLGGASLFWMLMRSRRWLVISVLPLSLPFFFTDPYYFRALTGAAYPPKIGLDAALGEVSRPEGLVAGANNLVIDPIGRLVSGLEYMPGVGMAGTLLFLFSTFLVVVLLHRLPIRQVVAAVLSACAAIMVMSLALSVAGEFRTDGKLYLLYPYASIAFAQLKMCLILLLACLAAAGIVRSTRSLMFRALGAAVVLMLGFAMLDSPSAREYRPKQGECGGLVCPSEDDIAALVQFSHVRNAGEGDASRSYERVLVLNSVVKIGPETWLFPVGGGRVAPFYDVGPVAYFYYQGDPNFTTGTYLDRVCHRFDRQWLLSHSVRYVFVPESASEGCLADMDALRQKALQVAVSGDAAVFDISAWRE